MHTKTKSHWIVLMPLLLAWVCAFTSCQGIGAGGALQKTGPTHTSSTGGCPAPSVPGVSVCQPPFVTATATDSPMQLTASATASQGKVVQMQVLADGEKIAQTHGSLFDEPVSLSVGTHTLTVVARETGGASLSSAPIAVEVRGSTAGQTCPPPSSPGVNVCAPVVGSGCGVNVCANPGFPICAIEPWVTFVASGTAQTGTVREMQLWVNGVEVANFPGNTLNTNLFFDIFGTVTIVEVDSKGQSMPSPAMPFASGC